MIPIFFSDVAGSHQELRRIDFILQVAAAQVFVISLLELHAVTRRAANIRSDANVAARGESLRRTVEGIKRLAGGSAVRQHHARIGSIALQVERRPQKRADGLAVESPVMDQLRGRKLRGVESGERGKGELPGLAGLNIIDPKVARAVGALVRNQQPVTRR